MISLNKKGQMQVFDVNVCIQNHLSVLIKSAVHHEVFTAGALEGRVRRTSALRAPAGKKIDVRSIMSTHKGSFVFIIHPS